MTQPAPERPEVSASRAAWWDRVQAVAGLAFREALRNRVLHALIGAMLLVSACSHLFAWVSGDEMVRRHKIVIALSLSALDLLGTLAAIFLGTHLIHQEVERRTVYTVLARPLSRTAFLLGKYLGLLGVMAVAVAGMGAGFLLIFALGGGAPTGALLLAIGGILVKLAVVVGLALLFSVAAHPIEGAVIAFVVVLAGHVTESLDRLGRQLLEATGDDPVTAVDRVVAAVLHAAYVVLPNLERFNLRPQAIHALPVEVGPLVGALVYAAVYVALLLALAGVVFRRKVL